MTEPTDNGAGVVEELTSLVQKDWRFLHDYIITPLGHQAYCLRMKTLVSGEQPKLLVLRQHHTLVLFGVYGSNDRRDRLVGYCLVFSGAPWIHHNPRYISFSYSEATDIRMRQVRFIFEDENVRLSRFGVGVFDYLWLCRKQTDQQTDVDVADHIAHKQFAGTWKDGV